MRQTKPYLAVRTVFAECSEPLSLKDVWLKLATLPFSTVYRVTQKLLSNKEIISVDWRERGCRYEWAAQKHHHHIVCESCGKYEVLDEKVVGFNEKKIAAETNFKLKSHSIEVFGLCPKCQ